MKGKLVIKYYLKFLISLQPFKIFTEDLRVYVFSKINGMIHPGTCYVL